MNPVAETDVVLRGGNDLLLARRRVREAASGLGFGLADTIRVVTAASELARNILEHAGAGVMRLRRLDNGSRPGLELTFEDRGPGLADPARALRGAPGPNGRPGLGLSGTRRLVDGMNLESSTRLGTRVQVWKWRQVH